MDWKLLYEQSHRDSEKLKTVNSILLDRIDSLESRESNYKKTQEEALREKDRLSKEIENLNLCIEETGKENNEIANKIITLEKELNRKNEETEELNAMVEDKTKDMMNLEVKYREVSNEKDEAEDHLKEINEENVNLKDRYNELKTRLNEMTRENTEILNRYTTIQNEIKNLNKGNFSLTSKNKDLRKELEKLQQNYDVNLILIRKIQKELENIKKENERLIKENLSLRNHNDDLREEIALYQNKLEEYRNRIHFPPLRPKEITVKIKRQITAIDLIKTHDRIYQQFLALNNHTATTKDSIKFRCKNCKAMLLKSEIDVLKFNAYMENCSTKQVLQMFGLILLDLDLDNNIIIRYSMNLNGNTIFCKKCNRNIGIEISSFTVTKDAFKYTLPKNFKIIKSDKVSGFNVKEAKIIHFFNCSEIDITK